MRKNYHHSYKRVSSMLDVIFVVFIFFFCQKYDILIHQLPICTQGIFAISKL